MRWCVCGGVLIAIACMGYSGGHADETAPPPRVVPNHRDGDKALELLGVGRTREDILGVLNQLAEEWTAIKGQCQLIEHQFTECVQQLRKAREQLQALEEPKAKTVPMIFQVADVETALVAAQQLVDYQTRRQQRLKAVQTAAQAVLDAGIDRDLTWARAQKHLARMEGAARWAGKQPDIPLLPAFAPTRLIEETKWLANVKNNANPLPNIDLRQIEEEIGAAATAAAAYQAQREQLQRSRDHLVAILTFRDQLKALPPAQLTDEFTRLQALLQEKLPALRGDQADYTRAVEALSTAKAQRAALGEPQVGEETQPLRGFSHQSIMNWLFLAQQHYSARIRMAEEATARTQALIEAYENAEKRAQSYANTLAATRLVADQLAAVIAEIEQRIGAGLLDVTKAPPGFRDAGSRLRLREELTGQAQSLAETLPQWVSQRMALRKTDDEGDNIQALTRALLSHVSQRLDLLSDLKKLDDRYTTAYANRSESEQKRLEQRAAARWRSESTPWDWLWAYDRSQTAAEGENLLKAYYRELIDLEEKQDLLEQQKQRLEKLIELTRKEASDIAKLRTVLVSRAASSEAVRPWDQWLSHRLAPTGLEAEIEAYREETARLNTLQGANARRIAELIGPAPAERDTPDLPQAQRPARGGEIGRVRAEWLETRLHGWRGIGIQILIVLVAAWLTPRLILFLLRRRLRGGSDAAGNPSPVLAAVRGPLRLAVWVAALALILHILGFDVTALIVALAIAALAIALAARPMIADVLGALVIFGERRFQVGDVIRLGTGEPARVTGLTWRSTTLKNAHGLVVSVPNRHILETTVETLSRGAETYDTINVTITTDKDAGKVINVIRAAMAQCKNLTPDHGVTVLSYNQKGHQKVVQYRFWWFLKDYEARNKTRDEVFARVALGLAHEDMGGIELTMA